MKIVTVCNLNLQFDVENDVEVTDEMIDAYIKLLNGTMSTMYNTSQPMMIPKKETEISVIDLSNF